jgi:hypothetical protein
MGVIRFFGRGVAVVGAGGAGGAAEEGPGANRSIAAAAVIAAVTVWAVG